jgi:hypothetical protein
MFAIARLCSLAAAAAASAMLQPKRELGVVTMTNISGPKANDALMAITELPCKRFSAN